MRLFGSIAFVMIVLALPASASAKTCGQVVTGSAQWQVKVERGNTSCSEARRIIHKLYTGKERGRAHGEHHNPPRDLAETFWLINGWRCAVGAGGGGCIRRRDRIAATFVPTQAEREQQAYMRACEREGYEGTNLNGEPVEAGTDPSELSACIRYREEEAIARRVEAEEEAHAKRTLIDEAQGELLEGEQRCRSRGGEVYVSDRGGESPIYQQGQEPLAGEWAAYCTASPI